MKPGALQKAIIYCRVSSKKQVREGDGLRSQETRCREYAAYKGYDVVEVYCDQITGGEKTRKGILSVAKFLRAHRKDSCVVIIDHLDRFAKDVRGHWDLRDLLKEAGGKLESPSMEFGDDADSILRENLLASVAQHQRQKNAEQTKNRMRARAMNGYWVFHPPIGYRFERVQGHGKLLVPDEPLASILKEAFESYASGRLETITEIKRFLEAQPAYPRNRNDEVHIERVAEIISRPVYAGYISVPDWGLSLVPGKHKPLVSLATWQAMQDRRTGTARVPARKDIREDFPLRGFVTCAECGEPYTACWSKGRSASYAYYLCDTKDCTFRRKSIRREVIEGEFEALLRTLQPTEGLFALAFALFRDLWDARLAKAKTQGATLETDVSAIERKIAQMLDRLVDASTPTLVAAYEKRIGDLEVEKALLRERTAACGRPLASFGETYRTAFAFLANPYNLWTSPRLEDRRAVLKLVFSERLMYARGVGYRTAEISAPFKMFQDVSREKNQMVRVAGVEPALLAEPDFESGASTNSTTPAYASTGRPLSLPVQRRSGVTLDLGMAQKGIARPDADADGAARLRHARPSTDPHVGCRCVATISSGSDRALDGDPSSRPGIPIRQGRAG